MKDNIDVCAMCGRVLAECETIWAAEGELFCCEECGRHGVDNFDDVSEEVVPADIGIVTEGGN